MDDGDFAAVLAVAMNGRRHGLALMLLLTRDAALRAATAYGITSEHVTDGKLRSKTKWDGSIVVPMSARLAKLVGAAMDLSASPDQPLVCSLGVPPGRWLGSTLRKQLEAAQKIAGCGHWTWHDLRRTAAQRLYARCGDLRRVQVLLGHRSMLATLHYLNASREATTSEDVELFAAKEIL